MASRLDARNHATAAADAAEAQGSTECAGIASNTAILEAQCHERMQGLVYGCEA